MFTETETGTTRPSEIFDFEVPAIVFDNGSWETKIGFAGDVSPGVIFPTIVGNPRKAATTTRSSFAGEEALSRRDILDLRCPVEHGIVTNWDDLELVWQHSFRELGVQSTCHPLLFTEPPVRTRASREKMMQTAFETFNVPAAFGEIHSVLALYASARTTGIVIDSGDSVTYAVPIYEGYALPHAILRMDFAGRQLTDFMMKLLSGRGQSVEREIARDIKETLCFVTLDFEHALHLPVSDIQKQWKIPDGRVIGVGDEVFRCPEAMFKSTGVPGVARTLFESIMKCDTDIRSGLFSNVVLSGGSTLFPGFEERIRSEVSRMASPSTSVNVIAIPDRKYAAWIGGSILASLPAFRSMWVTKQAYDEQGPSALFPRRF